MRCKDPVVVEAVVWCVLCVSLAVCCSVPVCCSVHCCFCCCGVVVGERRGSSSPREVATVGDAATQRVGCIDEDDVDASATAVVAMVAETCLVEVVEEENVETPDAKAKAARC